MKAKFTGQIVFTIKGAVKSASLRAPHIQPAGARAHRPQANPMARPMKTGSAEEVFPSSRDPVTSADSALPSTWPVPRICASSTPTNRVTLMKILHLLAVTLATLTAALALRIPRPPKTAAPTAIRRRLQAPAPAGACPSPACTKSRAEHRANPLPHPSAGRSLGRDRRGQRHRQDRRRGQQGDPPEGRRSRAGNMRPKGRRRLQGEPVVCQSMRRDRGATTGHPPGSRPRWKKHPGWR